MHYGIYSIQQPQLSQKDMEYLLSEESWGKQTWFAWYPVKMNQKWVWLRRIQREVFCVHMTGLTRTQYSASEKKEG